MTQTLFHVTPRRFVHSILEYGIMVECAKGKTRGVWLCDAGRLPWAVLHIAAHQGVRECDLSILHVNVNGLALRTIRKGVYVSNVDIATTRLFDVIYFATGEPE